MVWVCGMGSTGRLVSQQLFGGKSCCQVVKLIVQAFINV